MTDRNAPCPCGSGKKFKKCHGAGGAGVENATATSGTRSASAPASSGPGRASAQASSAVGRGSAPASSAPGRASPAAAGHRGAEAESPLDASPGSAAPTGANPTRTDEKPFLVRTGRGVESERADAERHKHLRRRIQTSDLKGTLVYNSGAFFRPPNT